ncbi:MAG TPA: L-aspartate oxidase, partial [Microbacterium sp.]|nr:L-aspartate oxidase [Microbacterium sp.]
AGSRSGITASRATPPVAAALPARNTGAPTTPFTRAALQDLMWRHAGLLRDGEGLRQAAETVAAWRSARPETAANDSGAEDDNLLLVAEHMLAAASARTGS